MNSVMNFSYEQFITKKIHHINWFIILVMDRVLINFKNDENRLIPQIHQLWRTFREVMSFK